MSAFPDTALPFECIPGHKKRVRAIAKKTGCKPDFTFWLLLDHALQEAEAGRITLKPVIDSAEEAHKRKVAKAKADPSSLEVVEVTIPRAMLKVAKAFAGHFRLAPQMVMEAHLYLELEAFGADLLQTLEKAVRRDPMTDMVTVKLEILSDVMDLVRLVARLLQRPLDWLVSLLVTSGLDLLSRQMVTAEKEGGIPGHVEMRGCVETCLQHALDARAGIFPKTVDHDAWDGFGLLRPAKEGGTEP